MILILGNWETTSRFTLGSKYSPASLSRVKRIVYGEGNSFCDHHCPHPVKQELNFNINIIAGHKAWQLFLRNLATNLTGRECVYLYLISLSILPKMENLQGWNKMLLSGAGLCQPKGQLQGDHVKGFALTTMALVQPQLGKTLPVLQPRSKWCKFTLQGDMSSGLVQWRWTRRCLYNWLACWGPK